MPKPNRQAIDHNSIVLGFADGGPDLTIPQSELRSLHAQQNGNKNTKDTVVSDRVKVKCYERIGGVPPLAVVFDPQAEDGTVYNIVIES